jgi:hypothetical protein
MWHFLSSCKGTVNHPGMFLNNMCTVMGWFSFCTVGCEVDNLKFLFGMSLHFSSPQITSCASFKPRPVPFIYSEIMFSFLVIFLCHLCHIVHDLFLLTTSFSFVCPCSFTRLQTVTGEFPSLLLIQLIEECSLQWCRVVWEYVEICDLLDDRILWAVCRYT